MEPGADPIVRFGVFEANLQTGELRKAGLRVKIQDQPMLVLAALVERAGELVTREELQQRLWQDVAHLDFEHGLNMAVRKLRAALNDSAETPRYIETLARKGYRFVGQVEFKATPAVDRSATVSVPDHPENLGSRPSFRRKIRAFYAAAGLIATLGTGAFFYGRPSQLPMKVVPVASSSGTIRAPSFSPDGKELAYELIEENGPSKIFLRGLDASPARRLTDDDDASHSERAPAWIPDGSGLSFVRNATGSKAALFSVPVRGGTPRKLIELGACRGYSWTPDARTFAVSLVDTDGVGTLFSVSLPGGHRQQLTAPAKLLSNTVLLLGGDGFPKFSPDGKWIAFVRRFPNGPALMVMHGDGGEPKELVPEGILADDMPLFATPSFAWTAESQNIVFAGRREASFPNLYQVPISGGRPFPLPFNAPGVGVGHLAASVKGERLVYTIPTHRSTIWRYDLRNRREVPAPQAIARSPQSQTSPDIAPDGRRFAFASNRSGVWQIYTAVRDGKNPVQLTFFERGIAGWPRWSPDGKHIAFDARPSGRAQVFVVDAEGGTPQTLAPTVGNAVMPAWSSDGAWIYYTQLDASGGTEIWKVGAAGGASTQVTSMGAYGAFPSTDDAALYVSNRSQSGIFFVPTAGGKSVKIAGLEMVNPGRVAVGRTGLYYIARTDGVLAYRQLMYYSFASKLIQPLFVLTEPASAPAIAVSRDENEFLLAQDEGTMSQLMLVEHFR